MEGYKVILRTESIGEVYPSYSNGEKDRCVFRPSRQNGVHDGFDQRKQTVKMAEFFGIQYTTSPRTDSFNLIRTDDTFEWWSKKIATEITKYQCQKISFVGFAPVPGFFKD